MAKIIYKAMFLFSLIVLLSSCKDENSKKENLNDDSPLLVLLNSKDTGINFTNTSVESPKRHLGFYDYFYNGSGVAIGDINNDGLQDVFFAGNDAPNRLYLNEGDFKFKNISNTARIESNNWATGVTMIDINNDGFLDIYVCSSGPYLQDSKLANKLYVNNGDLTFTEKAAAYGIADVSYSSQAVFFDMDADNDLDLFVLNHSLFNYGNTLGAWESALAKQTSEKFKKSCSTLYRNNGDETFTDVSIEAGIHRPGFGLGVAISDLNQDGIPDIYVTNDYFVPDFMFINDGNGTFVEKANTTLAHTSFYGMGCDAADFNNDGLVDLVVADMTPADHFRSKTLMASMNVNFFNYLTDTRKYAPQYMFNTLSLNRGDAGFSEIANMTGVSKTDWSWAALFVDLDNDTHKDLLVTNGFKRDTKDRDWAHNMRERFKTEGRSPKIFYEELAKANSIPIANYLYKNDGNLQFSDTSEDWGFTTPSFSNGAAYGDLDNDGDLDIVVNNLEKEAFVYKNTAAQRSGNKYLQVTLTDENNLAKVLGSKVKVYANNQMQMQEYSFVRGYLSTMQEMVHFGMGAATKIDSVEVIWPDKKVTTLMTPNINTKIIIDRKKELAHFKKTNKSVPLFETVPSTKSNIDFVHQENNFNDFKAEILLPHKQSTLGPGIAVGDVNLDGLDDFYVGGAKGQAGVLYLQNSTSFTKLQSPFTIDAAAEDLGAHFFDMDGDGDLDLYVASGGGGDVLETKALLQDRLYENMGGGTFRKIVNKLPIIASSTMAVRSLDWDADGDLDLFVGGRNTPGKYPIAPTSYLLKNENGIFIDVTDQLAPDLRTIGMVTDVALADLNGDTYDDLVIVGEWMRIQVFLTNETRFVSATDSFGLSNTTGWWYAIDSADFDGDGDLDFVVGNAGTNNKFNPSIKKPLHIFSHDFDANGTLDIVLSKDYKGNLAPVRGKECSTEQMPFLAEKFPIYADFASSSLAQIYGEENLQQALHYEISSFESVYLENKGDGNFQIHPLPVAAQMSPIHGFAIQDYDSDGVLDIVLAGNNFNTEAETPAYDAGKGLYLKGNGDGTFVPILNTAESGISLPLDCKDVQLIRVGETKTPGILVANNNASLQLLKSTNE